jgi:hypothetical protein
MNKLQEITQPSPKTACLFMPMISTSLFISDPSCPFPLPIMYACNRTYEVHIGFQKEGYSLQAEGGFAMPLRKIDFTNLLDVLPPIIWRSRWNQLADQYGLPYRRGYLQNRDCDNSGPKRASLNGRVAYRREDVVAWLNAMQAEK